MSVTSSSNGAYYRATSTPAVNAALSVGEWVKVGTYTSGRSYWCWSYAGDAAALRGAIGNGTVGASGALIVVWQQQGATQFFYTTVATGSFTGWLFVGVSHAASATSFNVAWRVEGASSMSTATVTGCSDWPGISNVWAVNKIFDDETSPPAPGVSMNSYGVWSSVKTTSDWLTQSQQLGSMVSTTNAFVFLPFSVVTGAGTDTSGAGHNYTAEGSPATDASTPNAAIARPTALFMGNVNLLY